MTIRTNLDYLRAQYRGLSDEELLGNIDDLTKLYVERTGGGSDDRQMLQASLMRLIDQRGQRDSMSGAKKASLMLPLDETHELVVIATIHDRRRERLIATIAVTLSGIVTLGAIIVAGSIFWHL